MSIPSKSLLDSSATKKLIREIDPSMRPPVVKLLFSLTTWGVPSVVNRASGFLKREASVCLERTSIRAGFSLPDTRCCIRPRTIPKAPGNPKGERNRNLKHYGGYIINHNYKSIQGSPINTKAPQKKGMGKPYRSFTILNSLRAACLRAWHRFIFSERIFL